MRLIVRLMGLMMSILLGIARNITGDITRRTGDYTWNVTWNSTEGVLLVTTVDRFLPTFRTFLGDYTTSMLLFERLHVFFFRNRPPEESDNKRSGARRGEFDSSTPEAIGVLLG